MKHLLISSLLLFTVLLFATPSMSRVDSATSQPAHVSDTLQSAPVMFIENVGQFDDDARFHVRGGDYDLWLASDALWITLLEAADAENDPTNPLAHREDCGLRIADCGIEERNPKSEIRNPQFFSTNAPRQGVNLKLSFVNANPQPEIEPFDLLETKTNYFLGNDKDKWRSNVPVWGGVRYKDIYPGIDLELTSENGRSVQRLVAHERANLDAVQLRVEGADEMELLTGTNLIAKTAIGDVTLPLFALVTPDGAALDITHTLKLNNNRIQAPFAPASQETVARAPDGTLAFSTFIGGSDWDRGLSLALDSADNAVVTGNTRSSDFPTTAGSYDTTHNGNQGDGSLVRDIKGNYPWILGIAYQAHKPCEVAN